MPRTVEDLRKHLQRSGVTAGVSRAYWPLGLYYNMPTFDVEAEALEGQVFDAGNEIAFMAEPGGRVSEDGQEIVISR